MWCPSCRSHAPLMAIQLEGLVCARCWVEVEYTNILESEPKPQFIPANQPINRTLETVAIGSQLSDDNSQPLPPIFPLEQQWWNLADDPCTPSPPLESFIDNSRPTYDPTQKVYRFDSAHAEPKRQTTLSPPAVDETRQDVLAIRGQAINRGRSNISPATHSTGSASKSPWVSLNDLKLARELMASQIPGQKFGWVRFAVTASFLLGQALVIGASLQGLGIWGIIGGIICSLSFFLLSWNSRIIRLAGIDADGPDSRNASIAQRSVHEPTSQTRKMKKPKQMLQTIAARTK